MDGVIDVLANYLREIGCNKIELYGVTEGCTTIYVVTDRILTEEEKQHVSKYVLPPEYAFKQGRKPKEYTWYFKA